MATPERDVERIHSSEEVVAKLRRLADALERGSCPRADFSVEH
jgi:hypothetical protein